MCKPRICEDMWVIQSRHKKTWKTGEDEMLVVGCWIHINPAEFGEYNV